MILILHITLRILGITHPISWNTAAVLLEDGKIVAAAEEERFNRIKHAPRMIPHNAIDYVLKKSDLKYSDIDKIAISWDGPHDENEIKDAIKKANLTHLPESHEIEFWNESVRKEKELMNFIRKNFEKSEIFFVRHHLAHAASTCYVSGFDKAMFITFDGRGEYESGLLGFYNNGELEIIRHISLDESLGDMYAMFTKLVGFRAHTDEGKVMGLAPYGKPKNSMDELAKVSDNFRIEINWKKLGSFSGEKLVVNDPTKDDRKNLAASGQHLLEKCVLSLVSNLKNISKYSDLCLAGGTALNIDMNGKIVDSGLIKNIYIQPASHDAGCALGAALCIHKQYSSKKIQPMEHAYLGPEYESDEIKNLLDKSGINYTELSDPAAETAELLSKNKVVGWMQGKLEFGPRALGSRSLLANPTNPEMWKKVNSIKNREYWRPLAPSIIEEKADEFFVNHEVNSPFMLLKFHVKENIEKKIPAVVHVDGSARPQTVSKKTNGLYWKLLKEFEKKNDVPVLLNTSLNLKGDPIVNGPEDALKTFCHSNMYCLCIDKFLIIKI